MKRSLFLLLSAMLILPCLLCGCGAVDADLDIWIATDNHYLSPSLHDGGEPFINLISNADGKVTHYSNEVSSALLDKAAKEKPDILILSGDLTLNGAIKSHEEFAEKLYETEEAGVEVLVIPGNHDVSSTGISFFGEEATVVPSANADDFAEIYKDFGLSEAASRDESSLSYIYEAAGKLRILMLDTNAYGKGFVQDKTYEWLERELKAAKKGGYRVMAVSHQNIFIHNELLSFNYQLYDGDELLELYQKYDVVCNFSGHIHVQSIKTQDGFTEVVTSATTMAPIQFGKLHYDGSALEYSACELDVSAWAREQDIQNPDLEDFKAYSIGFFEALSIRQAEGMLAETEYTDEEKALMAEAFAKINTKYFAGDAIPEGYCAEGVALWKNFEGFTYRYIETMINAPANSKNVTIDLR